VKYYAHTADGENGEALPESTGKWQPLAFSLARQTGEGARRAGEGFAEAELAGLLHDLGKSDFRTL